MTGDLVSLIKESLKSEDLSEDVLYYPDGYLNLLTSEEKELTKLYIPLLPWKKLQRY